jgi:phosphoglycerate transport regulatory protein PgtC
LQAATKAIYDAEAKLGDKANSGRAAELLGQARKLAWAPLIDGKKAADPAFLAVFAGNKKDASVNQQITQLEGEWNGRARANYEEAVKLAREAAAL